MYGKRKFSSKRIGAKLNWFNFRRKLTNAKSSKLRAKSSFKYYSGVVPSLRKKFSQIKTAHGTRDKVYKHYGLRSARRYTRKGYRGRYPPKRRLY